jgi:uncharacterized membrane protein YccF (DUF307 family)
MRTLGNILWLVLAGLWLAIAYVLAGIVMCLLIVTIPFGIERPDAAPGLGCLGNVLWIVLVGWALAVAHVVAGVLLCLTIIGIPLGIACFKLVPLALVPFGKEIVPADQVPPSGAAHYPPPALGTPAA